VSTPWQFSSPSSLITDQSIFIPNNRFSTSGSTHNLNCYDTSDNWTDNDMEIYMTRNATARTGLVPLWGRLFISWYIDVLFDLDKVFWHLDAYDRQNRSTPIVANDNLLFFVSLNNASSNDNAGASTVESSFDLNSLILSSLNSHKNDS
jgi:hypothetical protein